MMAETNTKRPGSTGVSPTLQDIAEEMRKLMAKAGGKRPDGMNISMTKLLQGMSADELRKLAALAAQPAQPARKPDKRWFDRKICGLNKEARKRLAEVHSQLADRSASQHVDRKWLRYAEAFKKMPFKVPAFFREEVDPKKLYRHLVRFCHENDLPDEIVSSIVPELVHYIHTGRMRPIIFVGERGCGKTTAVRLIIEEALRIPVQIIKAPDASHSHGLTGDSGTFKSADLGYLAKAQLRSNTLVVGYIIDEIDKVTRTGGEAGMDEELLSVTDGSADTIEDKYLESTLPSLPYCPIFMTGNDLKLINPILADRCKVIQYPNATPERIKAIMRKYVGKKLDESTFRMIDFDRDMLNRSIDTLVRYKVTSLRKHQELIEDVLGQAFTKAMNTDDDRVSVTPEMFAEAEQKILGTAGRKCGFAS